MQKTNNLNIESGKSVPSKKIFRGKVPPLQIPNLKTGGIPNAFFSSSHSEIPHLKFEDNLTEKNILRENQNAIPQIEIENCEIERKIKFGITRILENEVKSLTVQLCQTQEKVKLLETDLNIKDSEIRLIIDVT